jgi:hypothetical protein
MGSLYSAKDIVIEHESKFVTIITNKFEESFLVHDKLSACLISGKPKWLRYVKVWIDCHYII